MNLRPACCLGFFAALVSASTLAAPGEYWEITSKMDMPGMKFAMPAQTHKMCVPKGEERNPKSTQDKDSDCQMIDLKNSGNKTSWKMKCVHKGEPMMMEGESTHEKDSYSGKMHMSGKSGGRPMDMTQTYRGKRVGGACDTMEAVNKMNAAAAKAAPIKIPEAKAAKEQSREASRKRNCEGRGYTARSDLSNCLAGKDSDSDSGESTASATKSKAKKSASETVEVETRKADNKAPSPSGNPSVDDVLNTANKLKGLLRF